MTTHVREEALALAAEAQDLLFREARTANTVSKEPVDDEQLRAIYDLVKWVPTSMHVQPLRRWWCAPTMPSSDCCRTWRRATAPRPPAPR
jgi:hypothetical protein